MENVKREMTTEEKMTLLGELSAAIQDEKPIVLLTSKTDASNETMSRVGNSIEVLTMLINACVAEARETIIKIGGETLTTDEIFEILKGMAKEGKENE